MTSRSEKRRKLLDAIEAALDRVEAELGKETAEALPGGPEAAEIAEEGNDDGSRLSGDKPG